MDIYIGVLITEADDTYYADYENIECVESDKFKCYDLLMKIRDDIIHRSPDSSNWIIGYKIYRATTEKRINSNHIIEEYFSEQDT